MSERLDSQRRDRARRAVVRDLESSGRERLTHAEQPGARWGTCRTDIYSLAVIAVEVLTGELALRGPAFAQIMKAAAHLDPFLLNRRIILIHFSSQASSPVRLYPPSASRNSFHVIIEPVKPKFAK